MCTYHTNLKVWNTSVRPKAQRGWSKRNSRSFTSSWKMRKLSGLRHYRERWTRRALWWRTEFPRWPLRFSHFLTQSEPSKSIWGLSISQSYWWDRSLHCWLPLLLIQPITQLTILEIQFVFVFFFLTEFQDHNGKVCLCCSKMINEYLSTDPHWQLNLIPESSADSNTQRRCRGLS